MEGKLLLGHAQQVCGAPGTAGGSFAGQQVRQPIFGPGRPRECGLAGGGAEVGIDLAGDVALEAADDFLLRQALFGAPLDVGAGGGVGAHPGDHDPPQGVVGLPVTAAVEAVAGAVFGESRWKSFAWMAASMAPSDRFLIGAGQARVGGL